MYIQRTDKQTGGAVINLCSQYFYSFHNQSFEIYLNTL